MGFRIEARTDLAACDEAVRLQSEVWGDAVVVPSNMLFASVHVGAFLALADAEREVPWLLRADDERPAAEGALAQTHLLVAAPWDFQSIKARDSSLARAWRDAHRRTLGPALRAGYAAVEYLIDAGSRRGA